MDKNCNIIRDLLPLYAEDLLSEDSRALVENHLVGCKECQRDLESIKNDIKIPTPYDQTKIIEAFVAGMKKYKNYIFTIIFEVVIFAMMVIVGFGSLCPARNGTKCASVHTIYYITFPLEKQPECCAFWLTFLIYPYII